MIPWPFVLAAALVFPLLGHLLAPRASRALPRARRPLALFWHLVSILLWAWLAFRAGEPRPIHLGWDLSQAALVLAAGMIWVESLFLLRLYTRRRRDAPRQAAGLPEESEGGFPREPEEQPAPEGADSELSPEAEALLQRILELERIPVDAIMTPRERIVFLDATVPLGPAVERMRATGLSRLPVSAGGSLDRILGVVHAKDLVPLSLEGGGKSSIRPHLRRWLRVPQGLPAARLLEEFRRNRLHIGIVGDPLGQTLGIVTLGDVFRHIAGRGERPALERGSGEARS